MGSLLSSFSSSGARLHFRSYLEAPHFSLEQLSWTVSIKRSRWQEGLN